jgi:hypothetical protein
MVDAVDDDESRILHSEISFDASLKKRHRNRSSEPIWCHDLHVDIIAWYTLVSIVDRLYYKAVKRILAGLLWDEHVQPRRSLVCRRLT